jgi:DNA adenine methylase
VFFHLEPSRALLADANADLMLTYVAVRDQVEDVITELRFLAFNHNEPFFYTQRDIFNEERLERRYAYRPRHAARFIYLNRTGFNGLWRVNAEGAYNVPFGRYDNPEILNEERLRAASVLLKPHRLLSLPFDLTLAHEFIGPHDFVYLDPPYAPLSDTANFAAYTEDGFDTNALRELRKHVDRLSSQGAKFMLSNSDTAIVREVFAGYGFTAIDAPRSVGASAETRGKVGEVVVRNYG